MDNVARFDRLQHVDSVNNLLFVRSALQTGSTGQSLLDPKWPWV
jgi:hypothetical protein